MMLKHSHLLLLAVLCPLLLAVAVWSIYSDHDRQWKTFQRSFCNRAPADCEEDLPKIRQVWLPSAGITDRCITCHMNIEGNSASGMDEPFVPHPGDLMKLHPVEKFGCTVCHDGQGAALTVKAAHGMDRPWNRPLLRGVYAYSSCGMCHPLTQGLSSGTVLPGGETYPLGWRMFNRYNCAGCHKVRGYERPEHAGPSLMKISSKIRRKWLSSWLRCPRDYFPDAKMPSFRLSEDEIADITAWLLKDAGSDVNGNRSFPKELRDRGVDLINSLGCLGCHKLGNRGVAFGPDFSDIGNKVRPEWLIAFLKHPKSYDPETTMPDFNLNDSEIRAISAYLMSQKRPDAENSVIAESSRPGDPGNGRALINELGCAGCHKIKGIEFRYNAPELSLIGEKRVDQIAFGNVRDIPHTLLNWLQKKVADPGAFNTRNMKMLMPDFGFSEEEVKALTVFLLGQRRSGFPPEYVRAIVGQQNSITAGRALIERYNCRGCHELNSIGGKLGPSLDAEAAKSRPGWVFNFLQCPFKIRPPEILPARMPDFRLSGDEAEEIVHFLFESAGMPYPYERNAKRLITREDIYDGEKLYMEVFACIACHSVDGRGGKVGPDHTDLASRLKRPWLQQWLRDPQALKPDVRMPRFRFEDWQFEALTNYLMTLGKYRFVTPASP